MSGLVHWLQIFSGIAWLGPFVVYLPPFLRCLRRKPTAIDAVRFPLFANAAVQIGFTLRWLYWPASIATMGSTQLAFWAMLYGVSILAALTLFRAHFVIDWQH